MINNENCPSRCDGGLFAIFVSFSAVCVVGRQDDATLRKRFTNQDVIEMAKLSIRRGSSSGTRQAADRSAPTYRSSASSSPTGWRRSSQPNLAPKTYEKYEAFTRLHIVPYLGGKRLDKLQVKDIRQWLNKLAGICLCCDQGKDAARPEAKRRCCAIGKCCHQVLSARSRKDARDTLRAALTCAVEDEIIPRNPVYAVKLSGAEKAGAEAPRLDSR